jgi:ComEC/Rec2-related protein
MKLTDIWPRQPFIGVALAAICGIAVADCIAAPAADAALVVITAAIALMSRRSAMTYLFAGCCFFFMHGLRATSSPGLRLARELGDQPQAIVARGIVTSEPRVSAKGTASFLLKLSGIERDGQRRASTATISASWRGEVQLGDELQLFGVAAPIQPPRNPGEFDYRSYLARRDVRHGIVVRYPENGRVIGRARGNLVMRAALAARRWMQTTLGRGLEDSPDLQSLISSMVLGAQADTPDEIEEQFQQTGTLHLFAVSGLNVAIVAQLLLTITTAARLPRPWAIGIVIAALFFYAAVTGLNASSVRAALMAAVFLIGFFAQRKVLLGNTVAAAALVVLCWDTNELFSTGFQLSFAVVILIVWLADPILRMMTRWSEPDPFLPKSLLGPLQQGWRRGWQEIARGASVSLAAWIGSLPLILPYFYIITPVSLFANLVVVPLAFLVLAVGLMSLMVAPFAGWLAIIFNNANWSLAASILSAVGLFARAPAGHVYVGGPRWPDGARAEITALDVGAGAAIHLRTRAHDRLVDCGPERDFKRIVRGYLRSRGVNGLDALLLTHGDSAHIGAAASVIRGFHPRDIIDTAAPDRSSVHKQLIALLGDRHIARRVCVAGDELDLARDAKACVLFPPGWLRASTADDQALVAQVTIANHWRVLLMSDSGEATERWLINSGADLRSDIVIKGQPHAGTSGSPEFLDHVQPEAIIASSTTFGQNEAVPDDWAAMLAARNIKLLRQDETGAVSVRFFADRWEAKPYLGSEIFRSSRR